MLDRSGGGSLWIKANQARNKSDDIFGERNGNLGANAHFRSSPDCLAFEPVKRPDNTADYCLGCSFPNANTRYSFLQLSGLRHAFKPRLGANSSEVSAHTELSVFSAKGLLAMLILFCLKTKNESNLLSVLFTKKHPFSIF